MQLNSVKVRASIGRFKLNLKRPKNQDMINTKKLLKFFKSKMNNKFVKENITKTKNKKPVRSPSLTMTIKSKINQKSNSIFLLSVDGAKSANRAKDIDLNRGLKRKLLRKNIKTLSLPGSLFSKKPKVTIIAEESERSYSKNLAYLNLEKFYNMSMQKNKLMKFQDIKRKNPFFNSTSRTTRQNNDIHMYEEQPIGFLIRKMA